MSSQLAPRLGSCRLRCMHVVSQPSTASSRSAGAASCSYTGSGSSPVGGLRLCLQLRPGCSRRGARCAATNVDEPEGDADSLASAFSQELSRRQEVTEAADLDGAKLLQLLQQRYQRSYDVSLVQRQYMGKTFIALNIMWLYKEQQSFTLTEEEYMERLNDMAAVLVAWGQAATVTKGILEAKDRPRVGKAVSIFLDVDEATWRDFFMV